MVIVVQSCYKITKRKHGIKLKGVCKMEKIRLYLTKEGKNRAVFRRFWGGKSEGSLKEVVVLADGKYLQTYFGIDLWEDLLTWYEARPTQEDTNK
tara:strand:+ start:107 stop:391 length:285 start_codon:yes stop_codon:yes gene_type:complete